MKIVYSLLIFIFLIACQKREEQNSSQQSTNQEHIFDQKEESDREPNDERIREEEKLSSFMDFFSSFMWGENYQKSHIGFPLDFRGKLIENSNDWPHLPFYTNKPFMPILYPDSIAEYDYGKTGKDVQMDIVSLEKKEAERYQFVWKENSWKLMSVSKVELSSFPDDSFLSFLKKYSADEVYQKAHTAFPFSRYTTDYEEGGVNEKVELIEKKNWKFLALTNSLENLMMLNYSPESNYRIIFLRGVENGIHVRYLFKKKEDAWNLIRMEDYST